MIGQLDINTERGRVTLLQEQRAIDIFHHYYPDMLFCPTPKDQPAVIDGFIIFGERLHAIAEVKCRVMTLDEFQNRFRSEWLVTYDKIEGGRRVANDLRVYLWGLLYLVPDDVVLCKTLYRFDTGWHVRFGVRKTDTQATVNGGRAMRDNAFIDMSESVILYPPMVAV